MICQIANVKTQTVPLLVINRGLLKNRHIQASVKEIGPIEPLPTEGYLWSPMNTGPYLVPITRWIE